MCRIFLCAGFTEVCALSWTVLAVEVPIGLPPTMERGGRVADREARALLGRRAQVVAAPSRSVLQARNFAEASRLCQTAGAEVPAKLSRMAFHLFPYIREVDQYISPLFQEHIYETHSELAFLEMRRLLRPSPRVHPGRQQWPPPPRARPGRLRLPPPRRTHDSLLEYPRHCPEGAAERCALLRSQNFSNTFLEQMHFPKGFVREADFLAACAACWTARRIFRREEYMLPELPPENEQGLRMEKRY